MSTKKEKCCSCKIFGGKNPACVCPCHSQSESIEWESTVYIQKTCKVDYIQSIAVKNLISQAITTAVAKRELELVEEVEKLGNSCEMNTCGCGQGNCEKLYQKILSLLKH